MIAPSAAFAKHEVIVRAMWRSHVKRNDFAAWAMLPAELRNLAQQNMALNPSKSADILQGNQVFLPPPAPLPN